MPIKVVSVIPAELLTDLIPGTVVGWEPTTGFTVVNLFREAVQNPYLNLSIEEPVLIPNLINYRN